MRARSLDKLFDRFRRHREGAVLAEIFDRAAPELFRVAYHLTGSRGEAEDRVQETFLALLQGLEGYESRGRFMGWLLGILTNKCLQARARRRGEILPEEEREDESPDPPARAQAGEVRRLLERAILALPEPYRRVLEMHLREEKSPLDIARELGRNRNTVRSQLQRGLERLRRGLPPGLAPALVAVSAARLGAVRELVLARAASLPPPAGCAGVPGGVGPLLWGVGMAKLLVVFVVGLAGVAALWALAGSFLAGPEVPVDPAGPGTASLQAGGDPVGEEEGGGLTRQALPAGEGARPAARRPLLPGRETFDLLVLDAAEGKPIPGAEVYWLPMLGLHKAFDRLPPTRYVRRVPSEEQIRQWGYREVADRAGQVRLPRPIENTWIHAYHDDLAGRIRVGGTTPSPRRLALGEAPGFSVKVVDREGRPVGGVPLVASAMVERDGEQCTFSSQVWAGVSSQADGVARIRLVGDDAFRRLEDPVILVHFDIPHGREGYEKRYTGQDPLVMVLPPMGSVEVSVRSQDGRPLPEDLVASFFGRVEPVEDGRALFPLVGLDGLHPPRVEVWSADGWSLPRQEKEVSWPRSPGERVQVEMTLTRASFRYRARLVDEKGRPAAGLVHWRLRSMADSCSPQFGHGVGIARLGSGGELHFGHTPETVPSPSLLEVCLWRATDGQYRPRGPRVSRILPIPGGPGLVDLGRLTCGQERVLVAGKVLDEQDRPLPDVSVTLHAIAPGPGMDGGSRRLPIRDGRTDGSGGFALTGVYGGQAELQVRSRGFHHSHKALLDLPVADPLTLTLPTPGVLRGSVRAEKPLLARGFRFVATCTSHPGRREAGNKVRGKADFEIAGLLPGTYTLSVRGELYGTPITVIDGIQVTGGETCPDPRLQGLDLRGRARLLRLEIVNPDVAWYGFWVKGLDQEGNFVDSQATIFRTGPDRRTTLLCNGATRTFLVGGIGCRTERIHWSPEVQPIRFRPAYRPRITLRPEPAGRFCLTYGALGEGLDEVERLCRLYSNYSRRNVDELGSGETTQSITFPAPGRYRIHWQVWIAGEGWQGWQRAVQERPTIITIAPTEEEQSFTLGLTKEEMAAARRRFLRR